MLRAVTASGTTYEVDGARVRRLIGVLSEEMRRDEDWLTCRTAPLVRVGYPIVMALEPLGAGDVTIRMTTAVLTVEEVPADTVR